MVLDVLLVAAVSWCVLPPLLGFEDAELPLPFGGSFSATLSRKHLVEVWVLLLLRQGLGAWLGGRGIAAFLDRASAAFRGVLLFATAFLVFLAIHRDGPISGDTVGAKLLGASLLEEGDLDLDEFWLGIDPDHRYTATRIDDRRYPTFPLAPGLVALPIHALTRIAVPDAYAGWRAAYGRAGGDLGPNPLNVVEAAAAAAIAAATVVVVWSFARIASGGREAFAMWTAVAFGLGTPLASTSSGALWMHGPSCLALALLCRRLLRDGGRRLLAAGGFAGAAWAMRPSNALPLVAFGAAALLVDRARAWKAGLGAALVMLPVAATNLVVYGDLQGAYGRFSAALGAIDVVALATLLFSPSRGLFAWSPFLLVPVLLSLRPVRRDRLDVLLLVAGFAPALLAACYETWSGGYSLGPRLLAESALFFTLLMPLFAERIEASRALRILLVGSIVFSAHVHVSAAVLGDGGWTAKVFRGVQEPGIFWSVRDSQLAWVLMR